MPKPEKWYVYILKCNGGSYYTGVTNNVEERLLQHRLGGDPSSYTYSRRPVELVLSQECDSPYDAIRLEKQIQGWSRKKKEALIAGDWERIRVLAMNRKNRERHEKERASTRASTAED